MVRCLALVIAKAAGVWHMLYAFPADHNGDGSNDARMLQNSKAQC